jgi:hypothetical protein
MPKREGAWWVQRAPSSAAAEFFPPSSTHQPYNLDKQAPYFGRIDRTTLNDLKWKTGENVQAATCLRLAPRRRLQMPPRNARYGKERSLAGSANGGKFDVLLQHLRIVFVMGAEVGRPDVLVRNFTMWWLCQTAKLIGLVEWNPWSSNWSSGVAMRGQTYGPVVNRAKRIHSQR